MSESAFKEKLVDLVVHHLSRSASIEEVCVMADDVANSLGVIVGTIADGDPAKSESFLGAAMELAYARALQQRHLSNWLKIQETVQ